MMNPTIRSLSTEYSSSTCMVVPRVLVTPTIGSCLRWRKTQWYLRGWETSREPSCVQMRSGPLQNAARTMVSVWSSSMLSITQQMGNIFKSSTRCRDEKDCMVECQKGWMERPEFIKAVKEEYLNERSLYRETGIKQTRYKRVCSRYYHWTFLIIF